MTLEQRNSHSLIFNLLGLLKLSQSPIFITLNTTLKQRNSHNFFNNDPIFNLLGLLELSQSPLFIKIHEITYICMYLFEPFCHNSHNIIHEYMFNIITVIANGQRRLR